MAKQGTIPSLVTLAREVRTQSQFAHTAFSAERHRLSGGKIALGLMRGVITWSKARGAQEVLFHVPLGIDLARSHKLARRLGFTFIGGSYAKRI